MTNSVWQATIQNAAGDIVPGAEITVIDEGTGLNAVIYSNKAGAALTNPFNADVSGFAQFYSGPGEYRISAHDLGTGLTQTFDNWRLGDAGARDTGTDTGQVLLSEDAGLDNGETNFTSGNLNPNIFGGESSAFITGYAVNSGTAVFQLSSSNPAKSNSITVTGVFNVNDVAGVTQTNGAGVTPLLSGNGGLGGTVVSVTGLAGMTTGETLVLQSSGTATIKVN